MRGIDRHGGQQRDRVLSRNIRRRTALAAGSNSCKTQNADSMFRKRRSQAIAPALVLLVHEFVGQLGEDISLFDQCQAVGTGFIEAVFDLLHQCRYADFEKLVEIAGGDGEKLQPFQQRITLVFRLFEHTVIKREP